MRAPSPFFTGPLGVSSTITPSQSRGGNHCLFITIHLIPIPERSWKSLSLELRPGYFVTSKGVNDRRDPRYD
jgi:hypothetical protein